MRGRKKPAALTAAGDLGIDWERWSDGRFYRLKRKRHYPDVDPIVVRADAAAAAKRMGKAVVTTRDKMVPEKFVWVQFAEHAVGPGQPCPCGSRRLLRLQANFLRCAECKAQLLLTDEIEEDEPKETRATQHLRELTDVHLERRGMEKDLEEYRGYAWRHGTPVLVWAHFRLKPADEGRLRQEDVFDRVTTVKTLPFPELSELFDATAADVTSLWNGSQPDWTFVWERAPEPESAGEADEPLD